MYDSINPLTVTDFASNHLNALREAGLTVTLRHDFTMLRALNLPGKTMTPFFNPTHFLLGEENGFWFECRFEGKIVAIHAVKLQDHGPRSLNDLWQHEFSRIYGAKRDEGPLVHEAATMLGKSSYHGELWVHDDMRGRRIGPALAALGIAIAAVEFSPDRYYGFVTQDLTRSGYALREGFLAVLPFEYSWPGADPFLAETDYMVYLTRAAASRMVERALRDASYTPAPHKTVYAAEKRIGNS